MKPYISEIRTFAFSWVPKGWLLCDGKALSIKTYPTLYQLIGDTFGGDGEYFNLPDLRDKVVIGTGPGYPAFAEGGEKTHQLTIQEMPRHRHQAVASSNGADKSTPKDNFWPSDGGYVLESDNQMSDQATEPTGNGEAHDNMSPYLAINYAICFVGLYPGNIYEVTDDFTGTIRAFPKKLDAGWWLPCDGTVLPISSYPALWKVIGNIYGGDGVDTFALPDLRGRSTVSCGEPKGLWPYKLAEKGGTASVHLAIGQMPRHSHAPLAHTEAANLVPAGQVWANEDARNPVNDFSGTKGEGELMNPAAIGESGGDEPHNNMMPYLTLEYMISAGGDWPYPPQDTHEGKVNL
nr:tail fiber protein [uncultured Dyadobacter sp.]